MEREEVELLPSGLITCLLNSKEVRIMKISPERLTIRLAQEVKEINELKVIFYVFDENRYKEITIEKYIELIKQCTSLGFITNIIYILGLDPLDDVIKNMQLFSKYTNYFPSINIFQVHNGQDKSLCCDEYDKLEYILNNTTCPIIIELLS